MLSYNTDKILMEGLTFDDVLLIPAHSEVLPREVNVSSHFSKEIVLQSPIVSAARDTVTEAELAIQGYRKGGIDFVQGIDIRNRITLIDSGGNVLFDNHADSDFLFQHNYESFPA